MLIPRNKILVIACMSIGLMGGLLAVRGILPHTHNVTVQGVALGSVIDSSVPSQSTDQKSPTPTV
jgi:hypothetical protein